VDANAGHNPSDKKNAWRAFGREGKFPVGQIYKEERPSFEELSLPWKKPLAFMDLKPDVDKIDKILEKYKD
jgi:hypothetical protein